MNPIDSLAARYCVRQDARGFIEAWAFVVALAVLAVGMRRAGALWRGALGCVAILTAAFALAVFRWCQESAAASLGYVAGDVSNIDAKICYSSHAVETIEGWLAIAAALLAAVGLSILGVRRRKSLVQAGLCVFGALVALFFAIIGCALLVFSLSWCQSHRLF